MGARNQVGIGLSYRPAKLHRLAEFIPWNRFLGSMNVWKYGLRIMGLVLLEGKTITLLPSSHCFYTLTSAADRINKHELKKGILSKIKGSKLCGLFTAAYPPPPPPTSTLLLLRGQTLSP
jgi:hypothetical protein